MTDASGPARLKAVLRRLARPAIGPIDGRVGDINRRIETTRVAVEREHATLEQRLEQLSRQLDAVARSGAEAASYTGLELRRFNDLFAELADRSYEEYYTERLRSVPGQALDQLDEALAQVINYASGHNGFYAQAGLWFNPPIAVALGARNALVANVSERIVELPFAFSELTRLPPGARVLDVGSAESTFPLSAASLGYRVTAIDPRPIAYSHPNLTSFSCRFEEWTGDTEGFDAAFLISTIEHVGLGAYGEGTHDAADGSAPDRALLQGVRQALRPDGRLILTTPCADKAEVTELERIYDEPALSALLDDWTINTRVTAVRRDVAVWEVVESVGGGSRGVAMVVASPAADG